MHMQKGGNLKGWHFDRGKWGHGGESCDLYASLCTLDAKQNQAETDKEKCFSGARPIAEYSDGA